MTHKMLTFAAATIFSAVAFASPKTYTVVISKPLQVGTTELAPGNYKMALDGGKAIFTLEHHTAATVPVKVETAARKYSDTILDTTDHGGTNRLNSIVLGGSTNKVEFDQ